MSTRSARAAGGIYIETAARLLHCPPQTVAKIVDGGAFPVERDRVGRTIRISDLPAIGKLIRDEQTTRFAEEAAEYAAGHRRRDAANRRLRVEAWRRAASHPSHPAGRTRAEISRDRRILDAVLTGTCDQCDVDLSDLLGRSRDIHAVLARRVCAHVLHQLGHSPSYSARVLDRDHSTIGAGQVRIDAILAHFHEGTPAEKQAAEPTVTAAALVFNHARTVTLALAPRGPEAVVPDPHDNVLLRHDLGLSLSTLAVPVRRDVLAYVCDVLVGNPPRHDAVAAARGLWAIMRDPWIQERVAAHLAILRLTPYVTLMAAHARKLGWSGAARGAA